MLHLPAFATELPSSSQGDLHPANEATVAQLTTAIDTPESEAKPPPAPGPAVPTPDPGNDQRMRPSLDGHYET